MNLYKMDQLHVSYKDWLLTNWIKNKVKEFFGNLSTLGFNDVSACVERWVLSLANRRITDSIFSGRNTEDIYRKLYDELLNKTDRLGFEVETADHFVRILREGVELRRQDIEINSPYQPRLPINVSYKNYSDFYNPERLRLLNDINYDPAALMAICMKYSTLMLGGQQFSIPQEFADALYQNLLITNEGFASPFNSKFIDKPDGYYCSLFPEVEEKFRSKGNFFTNELEGNWEINPPFIESLVDSVANKIIQRLDNSMEKQIFVVILPNWSDTSGFQKLETLKDRGFIKRLAIKPRLEHHYDTPWGTKHKANFNSAVFFLSNDDDIKQSDIDLCLDSWK